ncbi:MAG: HEAT repeat domain-containing protein [Terriglobia bacterium]
MTACFLLLAAGAWGLQSELERQLQDPNPRERERTVRAIGEQGNPAYVPAVAALVQDSDERVRMTVVRSLIRLGSPASLPPLALAIRDGIPEIRYLAMDGIINFYLPGYVETGFGGFFRSVTNRVENLFTDVDTVVADPDIKVDPEVVRILRQTVTGAPDMNTRVRAARALGILRVQEAIPDLVEAAFGDNVDLILEALRAFQKIRDTSVGLRITFLLMYPQKEVQRAAAMTIGLLRAEGAIGDLRGALETYDDPDVQVSLLDALAFMPQEATAAIFLRHLSDRARGMRGAAALGLGRLKDPRHVGPLDQAYQSERDGGVRLALAFALVSHGRLEHLNELVENLSSRTRQGEARPYLIELARERPVREALYAHLYSRDTEIRKNLCMVFGASGDSASIAQLENLLRDRDSGVALEASRAVRILRSRGL